MYFLFLFDPFVSRVYLKSKSSHTILFKIILRYSVHVVSKPVSKLHERNTLYSLKLTLNQKDINMNISEKSPINYKSWISVYKQKICSKSR